MPTAPQFEWPQGEPLFETQWRAVTESLAGNGVLDNGDLALTPGTANREVNYAAGTVYYLATQYNETAGSVVLSAGDATNDRWDTIAFDTAVPEVNVREGTPAANPEPPDIGGDEILLGVVYIPANFDDVLDASQILNWRGRVSNEASEVIYQDNLAFYSATTVAGALDNAVDLFVDEAGDTMSGNLDMGGNDLTSVKNMVAPTGQAAAFRTDTNFFVDIDNDDSTAATAEFTVRADQSGTSQDALIVREDGLVTTFGDVVLNSGETLLDYSTATVLQARLGGPASSLSAYPLIIGTDVAAHLDGNDLLAANGGATIVDNTRDEVTRTAVDTRLLNTTVTSATYTTSGEEIIHVDTTTIGAASTITLASADTLAGRVVRIDDVAGDAYANNITVDTEGAETIDGSSSVTIDRDYGGVVLTSDGTNWFVEHQHPETWPPQEDFSGAETGAVSASGQGQLVVSSLEPGETAEIYRAVLTTDTVEAVDTGVDLKLVTYDNAGGFTGVGNLIIGDGATIFDDETGTPLASYTNAGTSAESIGVLVDNTLTTSIDIIADVEGRTGL